MLFYFVIHGSGPRLATLVRVTLASVCCKQDVLHSASLEVLIRRLMREAQEMVAELSDIQGEECDRFCQWAAQVIMSAKKPCSR